MKLFKKSIVIIVCSLLFLILPRKQFILSIYEKYDDKEFSTPCFYIHIYTHIYICTHNFSLISRLFISYHATDSASVWYTFYDDRVASFNCFIIIVCSFKNKNQLGIEFICKIISLKFLPFFFLFVPL